MSAVNNINGKSVLISGAAGAAGVGIVSKAKQFGNVMQLSKAATSARQVVAGSVVSGAESVAKQLINGDGFSVTQTIADASVGAISEGAGVAVKNAMQKNPYMKVLENQLDHAERVAKGSNPRSSRVAKVENAKRMVETYGDKEASVLKYTTEFFAEEFKNLLEREDDHQ